MMPLRNYILHSLLLSCLFSAFLFNPENIALSGSSSISYNDFRSSNPASIATHKGITIKIIGANVGFGTNFLSISNYNDINGANFEDFTDPNYYPKDEFYELFSENIKFNSQAAIILPFSDIVFNNFSFSSKIYSTLELEFPKSFIRLALYGNEPEESYDLNIKNEINIFSENSIGYSKKINNIAIGGRLKYLQGLAYGQLSSLSSNSSYFFTDTTQGFLGQAQYLMHQGVGGSGFAVDLGVIYQRSSSNWRFGISIHNLFGKIYWDDNNLTYNLFKDSIVDQLPLRHNEKYFFSLNLDTLNAMNMMSMSSDEIYSTEKFSVVEFYNLCDIPFDLDSLLVNNELIETEKGSYLLKTDNISTEALDSLSLETRNYITDYPTYLNLNMQKELKDDISICFNLTTGFSNSLTNSEKWKISTGLLFNRFKKTPITLGFSLGEQSEINSGFSIGRNIGPFSINYGLRLRDSFFLQSMKGMDSSLSIVFKVN
tara:strand:- start:1117 stop:2574 length:1458 start_codon:yes stop_codon:yes gene_type:complete